MHLPVLLTALLACTVAHAGDDTHVFMAGGEINYVGPVSGEANQKVLALLNSEASKPTVLLIRSPGGPTGPGIELGRLVHLRQLTVKVLDMCFSSCANYVFTAAPNKIVSNFAVVGYHGGLASEDFQFAFDAEQERMFASLPEDQRGPAREAMIRQIKEGMRKDADLEQQFFKDIGVQQRITSIGQSARYKARYGKDAHTLGWTYSVAGFRKLGVEHIAIINGPWKPQFTAAGAKGMGVFMADVN